MDIICSNFKFGAVMKIPFGTRIPNEKETLELKELGFNLDNLTLSGRYYFLNIPETSRFQVTKETPAFDRNEYSVKYNNVEVITINQKTAIYDSWVYFHLNSSAITQAIELNEEITPEQAHNMNKEPELTEYQQRLSERLSQLEFIIFGGGASRGYGKMIGVQFPYLKDLRAENPQEHDAFLQTKDNYKELAEMFPSWNDHKGLQAKYESADVGVFAALGASSENGEPPECSIM